MAIQLQTFVTPPDLNATVPPERRGIRRDYVRMMTLDRKTGDTTHSKFYSLDQYLRAGDLLVLNASRTVPAILKSDVIRDGEIWVKDVEVRLAHRKDDEVWEALLVTDDVRNGDELEFSPMLRAKITNYSKNKPFVTLHFSLKGAALYNQIYAIGQPVRYEYIHYPWDLDYYQTVYATIPGSVEMPSAGRAFSWELLFKLQRKGVRVAYIQLHTGLSYLLDDKWHQGPSDNFEEYVIPPKTVDAVNETKADGGRVIAVGTTVVRSLEASIDENGNLVAGSGWTNLYIDSRHTLKNVDGLITGFHEPEASHLHMLSAFIDKELLYQAYREAIEQSYLWHEFGDMNLIM